MRPPKLSIPVVLLIAVNSHAAAQTTILGIEKELQKALKVQHISHSQKIEAYWAAYNKIDKLMVKYLTYLLTQADTEEKKVLLRESQTKWLAYRDSAIKLNLAMHDGPGFPETDRKNLEARVYESGFAYKLTRARVQELEPHVATFKAYEEDNKCD